MHLQPSMFCLDTSVIEKGLDNSGLVETMLMDLSKAYDCLHHDLLIAKLDAYGLDKPSLNFINSYLRFRTQTKKNWLFVQ